jgi:hypothetical protein|tara:strand:+ start:7164 stop:7355 length:192 start_codon:yes stop_codon:yes gene_type:complete
MEHYKIHILIMEYQEDSYERALRVYGLQVEQEVLIKTTQVIGKHTLTTYKRKKKSKKKVVYKL